MAIRIFIYRNENMSQKYYTLITQQGAALLANATASGIPLKLTKMGVGDGNGKATTPNASQSRLVHEVYQAPINSLTIDENNTNQIIAELIIPENQGGWFIHEIGLYDENNTLVAVGNCPATYKPQLSEGSGRTQVIRIIIIVDNTDVIALKIDPAVILATRQYVDNLITARMTTHEKSTNHPTATTSSKGFVQLNSATDSTIENQAATPLAVKKVNEAVRRVDEKVKIVNDIAMAAVKRSGDDINGELKIKGHPVLTKYSYGIGFSYVLGNESIDEPKNQYSGFLFTQQQSQGCKPFDYSHVMRSFVGDSFGDIAIDVLSKRVKYRGVITYEQNPSYTGDYSWNEFITTANVSNYIPIGMPLPWPNTQPPTGWLECNGSMFNKNQFPKLAAAYQSGKLPDLRGEFIRGWDNARGADPYRVILDWQAPQISAHRHVEGWGEHSTHFTDWQREHYAPFGSTGIGGVWCGAYNNDFDNALLYTNDGTNGSISTSRGYTDWHNLNPDGLVGNETRPRNIAFMYIVKAE